MGNSLFTSILLGTGLLLALSGCSSTDESAKSAAARTQAEKSDTQTAALEGVDSKDAPAVAEDTKELAQVFRNEGKVANRGGYIKLLVNNTPITNYEIQRRAAFLKLRRVNGNRNAIAENELIEQALKLGISKRYRTYASDSQVNQAYARFAKRNRATPAQLGQQLGQMGVGASHFKEFIRTQISWQATVAKRYQTETIQVSERDVVTGLRKSGSVKPELTEYFFKQVVFVVPEAKRSKSLLNARKQEALTFRQQFPGCDQAVEAVKALHDVTIIDRRRILEPELPPNWKEPIINADAKGTTTVQETDNGVEFIAVCSKKQVSDDRAAVVAQQAEEFTSFNTKSSEKEQEYLKELREQATIVYK